MTKGDDPDGPGFDRFVHFVQTEEQTSMVRRQQKTSRGGNKRPITRHDPKGPIRGSLRRSGAAVAVAVEEPSPEAGDQGAETASVVDPTAPAVKRMKLRKRKQSPRAPKRAAKRAFAGGSRRS